MNKSLVNGIGDTKEVEKFYDDWSEKYDQSLLRWNYRAPKQSTKILSKFIKSKPKYLLDLACGTGLFLEEFRKIFPLLNSIYLVIASTFLERLMGNSVLT